MWSPTASPGTTPRTKNSVSLLPGPAPYQPPTPTNGEIICWFLWKRLRVASDEKSHGSCHTGARAGTQRLLQHFPANPWIVPITLVSHFCLPSMVFCPFCVLRSHLISSLTNSYHLLQSWASCGSCHSRKTGCFFKENQDSHIISAVGTSGVY